MAVWEKLGFTTELAAAHGTAHPRAKMQLNGAGAQLWLWKTPKKKEGNRESCNQGSTPSQVSHPTLWSSYSIEVLLCSCGSLWS